MNVTRNNPESWLSALWDALDRIELPDNDRDEVCTAMAWIREELGLPDEVESEGGCRNCDGAGCRHCDRDSSY